MLLLISICRQIEITAETAETADKIHSSCYNLHIHIIQYPYAEQNKNEGIFSLSKENKEATEKIDAAEKKIKEFETQKSAKEIELQKESDSIQQKRNLAEN